MIGRRGIRIIMVLLFELLRKESGQQFSPADLKRHYPGVHQAVRGEPQVRFCMGSGIAIFFDAEAHERFVPVLKGGDEILSRSVEKNSPFELLAA
jgi:hypothetical protein